MNIENGPAAALLLSESDQPRTQDLARTLAQPAVGRDGAAERQLGPVDELGPYRSSLRFYQ